MRRAASRLDRKAGYDSIVGEFVRVTLRSDGDVQKTRAKLCAGAPREPIALLGDEIEIVDVFLGGCGELPRQRIGVLVGRCRSLGHGASSGSVPFAKIVDIASTTR
jgi:hypothetical protein